MILTDKWFQVFQCNTNNFLADLFDTHGTLTGTSTSVQSELGSNDNKEILHTPQSYRTGVSQLDSV